MSQNKEESCSKTDTLNERINRFVSKFLWWLVGVVVMIMGGIYNNTNERITSMEDKVSFLYQDKVSRAELREVTNDFRSQNEVMKAEIMAQQYETKKDILARLDFLLRLTPPPKR